MLFNAPPISSITAASSAAKPVGSVGVACLFIKALAAARERLVLGVSGSASMEVVASRTRVLMEAMAEVKVSPAVALSAAVESAVREAAVESDGGSVLVGCCLWERGVGGNEKGGMY